MYFDHQAGCEKEVTNFAQAINTKHQHKLAIGLIVTILRRFFVQMLSSSLQLLCIRRTRGETFQT